MQPGGSEHCSLLYILGFDFLFVGDRGCHSIHNPKFNCAGDDHSLFHLCTVNKWKSKFTIS